MLDTDDAVGDKYRVIRHLADGGMGAVYLAEHQQTEEEVALKVLWPQTLESEAAVESFRQEARISSRIKSKYIVKILDAGYDDSRRMPYLVMEYLRGKDLGDVVREDGPLQPELAVEVLAQMAHALDRAHGRVDKDGVVKPIVHRDLKPDNLFWAEDEDGDRRIRILDYGIAKVLSQSQAMSQEIKGTPLFMAYEQATAAGVTPQTDIWALGLITLYLLTGQYYWNAAYQDAAIFVLIGEIANNPLQPPCERLSERGIEHGLPPAFDDWFLQCVNRDPEARFAQAGLAVEALAVALELPLEPVMAILARDRLSSIVGSENRASGKAVVNHSDTNPGDATIAASSTSAGITVGSNTGNVRKRAPWVALGAAAVVLAAAGGGWALYGGQNKGASPATGVDPVPSATAAESAAKPEKSANPAASAPEVVAAPASASAAPSASAKPAAKKKKPAAPKRISPPKRPPPSAKPKKPGGSIYDMP